MFTLSDNLWFFWIFIEGPLLLIYFQSLFEFCVSTGRDLEKSHVSYW